jgi:hypothetical protein
MNEESKDGRFERWLDGLLDDEESREVERELTGDPALASQRALQSQIDGALRQRFAPMPARELHAIAVGACASAWPWKREQRTWMALAAGLLLTFGIGNWSWKRDDSGARTVASVMREAYDSATPTAPSIEICAIGDSGWVRSKLQMSAVGCTSWNSREPVPVHTYTIDSDVAARGTPFDSCVSATVDGVRVLLWIASAPIVPEPKLPTACGFVVYRGELEGKALYEYTPLHEPVLLRALGAVLR